MNWFHYNNSDLLLVAKNYFPGPLLVAKNYFSGPLLVAKNYFPGPLLVAKNYSPGPLLVAKNGSPLQIVVLAGPNLAGLGTSLGCYKWSSFLILTAEKATYAVSEYC